jgi:hypothetical protein
MVSDPYLARVEADMAQWLALEAVFCSCDALCTCRWDEEEDDAV